MVVAKDRIERGRARAVLVNSGNANACTGKEGIALARSTTEAAAGALGADEEPGAKVAGAFFVIIPSIWILLGLTFAALVAVAVRCLAARRRYTFCLVMGGVLCLFMPFGTVLGVFEIPWTGRTVDDVRQLGLQAFLSVMHALEIA